MNEVVELVGYFIIFYNNYFYIIYVGMFIICCFEVYCCKIIYIFFCYIDKGMIKKWYIKFFFLV